LIVGLLAVVLGCERPVVDAALDELVSAGYARGEAPDGDDAHGHGPCLTEAGLALACGRAEPGETATDILRRVEACTLRCLAAVRSARQHSSRCEQQA
jgi:hypothetical protein